MPSTSSSTASPVAALTPGTQGRPIIVAVKPTGGDEASVRMARWIAARRARDLLAITVLDNSADLTAVALGALPVPQDWYEAEAARITADLRARIAGEGETRCRVEVLEGSVAGAITGAGRERDAGLIVVGTGHRGLLGRYLYGELAMEVVRQSAGAVLVVPSTAEPPIERAVVAVDFSQASRRAAAQAIELVQAGGTVVLAHVQSRLRFGEETVVWWDEAYERRTSEAFARFRGVLPDRPDVSVETVLLRGEPVDALLGHAEREGADVVACGRLRHPLVERLLVGSVSSALVRRARCSVCVAPEHPDDRSLDDGGWLAGLTITRDAAVWPDALREFAQRNRGRRVQLRIDRHRGRGTTATVRGYRLVDVGFDAAGNLVDILLENPHQAEGHLIHRAERPNRVTLQTDLQRSDTRLEIDADVGACTLTFPR